MISTGAAPKCAARWASQCSSAVGVTLFGLMLTPVFYVLLRKLSGSKPLTDRHGMHRHEPPHAANPSAERSAAPAQTRVAEPAYDE